MSTGDEDFDARMVDFLQRREAGESPDLDGYLQGLSPEQCAEFRALVGTADWVNRRLSVPLRPQAVLAGRYRLVRELGAGGFGKVWEAHDEQLDRRVAIKVLNLIAHSRDAASSLRRERMSLARLRHPGVVGIHEAGSSDDLLWLVMDLVEGKSLDKVLATLARGAFPPAAADLQRAIGVPPPPGQSTLAAAEWFTTAARIAVEMLRALEAAHAVAVLHRDLKPANLMLTGSCRPVLLDFGLASLRDQASHTFTERLLGTANYVAPEQARNGRVGNDPRTDVYQAGLILYELLTLRPAFANDGAASAVIQRVMRGDFPPPARVRRAVPRELQDICLRATELDPGRRYDSVGACREDLERWLRQELPEASRHGRVTRLLRAARVGFRRHRTAWLVAAALAVGIVPTTLWANARQLPAEVLGCTWKENGVEFSVRAHDVVEFKGVGFATDDAGQRTHVLPMAVALDPSGRSDATDVLRLQVTWLHPEDRARLGRNPEIALRPAYGRGEAERLEENWRELDRCAHSDFAQQPGVPIAAAQQIARDLATRGRSIPASAPEALWSSRPASSDGWLYQPPGK